MEGNINIGNFIKKVRSELVKAQASPTETPFYELEEVELEITFAMSVNAQGKTDLVVVKLGADTNLAQTHRVLLKLRPLRSSSPVVASASDVVGVSLSKPGKPSYGRIRIGGGKLPVYLKGKSLKI